MEIKPQDILFIIVLILLLIKRSPKLFVSAGIVCLLLAIPLYYKWIFFTAQRFTLYAFVLILLAILFNLIRMRHNK